MSQKELRGVERALNLFIDGSLERVLLSDPVDKDVMAKSRLRPLLLKGELAFQAEERVGKQAFHRNMNKEEVVDYIRALLDRNFRQAEVASANGSALILVSRKGEVIAEMKRSSGRPARTQTRIAILSHNRKKQYTLEEGKLVPPLVDLGVMTKEGKIVSSCHDKYRQIDRLLELIEDILPNLDQVKGTTIIDFGCGKSCLTFAMYYYLKMLREYPVHITDLDLKQDVIDCCSSLGRQYGYDRPDFYHGDIASYQGVDHADMVVTLHACDTVTDYALEKVVDWGVKVVLSVSCCQHEPTERMESDLVKPMLQYGLIRERMAALYTDAVRGQVLEYRGYRIQISESTDMEHMSKNILICAILQGKKKDNGSQIRELARFMEVESTIVKLLAPELLDPELLPPKPLVSQHRSCCIWNARPPNLPYKGSQDAHRLGVFVPGPISMGICQSALAYMEGVDTPV